MFYTRCSLDGEICRKMLNWNSNENHFFINPRLRENEAEKLLGLLRDTSSQFQSHIFLLSSGTTATSWVDLKWTALSKKAFLVSAEHVNRHLEIQSTDIWLHPLPDFHVGGLSIWARSALAGTKVVTLPSWSARSFTEKTQEHQATLTALVPAQVFDLVNEGWRCPPSLRLAVVGAGALAPELSIRARNLGWPLVATYGMTEACSQIATAKLLGERSGSGLPVLPHFEVKVDSDQRLCFRGESLFTSYIYLKEGRSTIEDPKQFGWFVSQDRGKIEGGVLTLFGRVGDFIKIGGESVELGRLNQILDQVKMDMKVCADVALLPVADPRLGFVIHLISDQNLTKTEADSLMDRYNSRVLAFEKMRNWRSMHQIPRTALGKLISSLC